MAYYESFYVRKIGAKGVLKYFLRNIDLYQIESWQYIDEKHTKIFTKSGDSFIAKINNRELTTIMMASEDEYGRLFIFNEN